jgi:hypothetical protein
MIARNEGDQAPCAVRRMSGVKILRQKRGGPVASVQIGLPEEAGGDRAPRPPSLGERAQFAFKRTRFETKPLGYRELQTKIGGRPDIGPPQREYQIDFGAPPSDALERQQLGHGSLVVGAGEPDKIERAAGDQLGEMAGIAHLLAAETAGTKGRIVERKKGCRRQRATEREEPSVHRCRGIDRHLLLENDVQKRAKPIAAAAKTRRTRMGEDAGKHRLGSEDRYPLGETLRGIGHRVALCPLAMLVHGASFPCCGRSYVIVRLEPLARLYLARLSLARLSLARLSLARLSLARGGGVRVGRRIRTALLVIGLTVLLLGLALRIYMGSGAEDRLKPGEAVRISELRSPLPKNAFLACPPGYCAAAEAITSPVFDMAWDRLREYWMEMISGEMRIVRALADPGSRRYVYIQHSPVFRFPDIITVEFVSLGSDRSSLALYSRSRYGEYDFLKNRSRVERWLLLLEKVAQPATPSHKLTP